MAEGFGKSIHSDKFNFYSAGTTKHGLNPYAIKVMAESGIDITTHESNTLDEFNHIELDYVFTVCSDAHENCPYISRGKIIHVGFDDPPRLTKDMTDEEKVLNIYRKVRDEIKQMIQNIESRLEL
jgi:arsenate reductase